jgi:predicted ABC-type ATPase
MTVPRLRMFAGPNGSGKSTIKSVVPQGLLGVYLNPDEMQQEIAACGFLEVGKYGVECAADEILDYFARSTLLQKANMLEEARRLRFAAGKLDFAGVPVNAYYASVAADFLRRKLLENRVSFSFETVMSSPDKVDLLEKASRAGYRTYLYYIATDDPAINVARVKARVDQGGRKPKSSRAISGPWICC